MRTNSPFRQRGVAAVEFGIVAIYVLAFMFAVLEFARYIYVYNAIGDVTRRAARLAAVTDFTDANAINALKVKALFSTDGQLPFAPDINSTLLQIDYLSVDSSGHLKSVSSLPACPAQNRINCANDSHGANCIRFVRASLCKAGSSPCSAPDFSPVSVNFFVPHSDFTMTLPLSTASMTVPAQSLGYTPTPSSCP